MVASVLPSGENAIGLSPLKASATRSNSFPNESSSFPLPASKSTSGPLDPRRGEELSVGRKGHRGYTEVLFWLLKRLSKVPSLTLQSRISAPAVFIPAARVVPSGENARPVGRVLSLDRDRPRIAEVRRVPEVDGSAGGDRQQVARGMRARTRSMLSIASLASQAFLVQEFRGGDIPEPEGPVVALGRDRLAIRGVGELLVRCLDRPIRPGEPGGPWPRR